MRGLFDLSGRVALVTGGSRGLGEEMAEGLAEAGAALFLLARRSEWLDPTLERLRGRGFRADGALADVSDADHVAAATARALEVYGGIDILVCNAGVTWGAPAEEMPLDKWQKVIDVDLTGAFLCCQAAGREMIRRGSGSIINIASIAGLVGTLPDGIHTAGYVAAKGGLIALTRELAAKWGRHNVRVNAIAPGFFPTRMTEKVLAWGETQIARQTPLGRVGRSGELKGVAVFLASDASSYVTGQTIAVDGGGSIV